MGLPHRKGVSFLSRIIPGKKKAQFPDDEDDVSEPETSRMDPDAAAQPIGFVPRFPPPPKYIRVRAHYKKEKTFNRVFLAQELDGADDSASVSDHDAVSTAGPQNERYTGKAIWALVFSNDGKYMAAAGQDRKVRVWQVVASPEDRSPSEPESDDDAPRLNAQVFKPQPIQVYEGHTGSILDLSWSKVP